MAKMTLSVSEGLKKKMDKLPGMDWSRVASQAISEKIELLDLLKSNSKAKVSEKDEKKFSVADDK